MARVFSAVDIEDPELRERLIEVREKLDLGFNPVEDHKFHITLQFFEDIDEKDIEKVKNAIKRISMDSFTAEVEGVGAFPSREYIRVLWAGAESEKFRGLHSQVSDHPVEDDHDHDFRPHITLLRVKDLSPDKKKKLQRMIKEFEEHRFGDLKINKVKLFESKLKPEGSEYRKLYVKEL